MEGLPQIKIKGHDLIEHILCYWRKGRGARGGRRRGRRGGTERRRKRRMIRRNIGQGHIPEIKKN